jgi:hypothetical protein
MPTDLTIVVYLSYCAFMPASIAMSTVILILFIKDHHLRAPPGQLVIGQLIYQLLFDLHYISGWPFLAE